MKFLVPIDLVQNELQNARIQNLSNAPTTPAPVAGQIYYNTAIKSLFFYDGTDWIDTKSIDDLGITDLEDVTITTPSGGQFLVYDSGTSKWVNSTVDLEDLNNVTFATPTTGQVVYFDGNGWVNQTLDTDDVTEGNNLYYTDTRADDRIAAASIGDLSDVDLGAGAADEDFLVYNDGTGEWEPKTRALSDLTQATADLDLNDNKIVNLATPTADSDAATKGYVDSVAVGLDVKESVKAATVGNVTLSGAQTIDGVALTAGDRVLVRSQSAGAENGIYVVASGAWSRSSDADNSTKLNSGAFTFVEEGTTLADTGWVLTTNDTITIGTTPLVFTQFSGAGTFLAGTGLTLAGNTFSVTAGGITATELAANAVTTAKILDENVTEAKLSSTLASKINAKLDSFAALVGNGVATSITVTHNFGTRDVQVEVFESASP